MRGQTIQKISDIVSTTIAQPFSHEDLFHALQGTAKRVPTNPFPHLAMAIAFGLGHRDLEALKRHLRDARRVLSNKAKTRHSVEHDFFKALYTMLRNEARLVEHRHKRRPGKSKGDREQLEWSRLVAASQASLRELDRRAVPLGDSAVIKIITPALRASSLATLPESEQFRAAVNALSEQFWRNDKLAELAGFFLMFDYYKCDNLAEASKVGEEMVRRNPHCLIAHTTLGSTYYFAQNFDKALASYAKAITLAPNNPRVHLGYAKIAWRVGQREIATSELAQVANLDVNQKLTLPLAHMNNLMKVSATKVNVKFPEIHTEHPIS